MARAAGSRPARCAAEGARFGPAGNACGFGLEARSDGGRQLVFHDGASGGVSSLVMRSLEDGCALIVLANIEGFDVSLTTWVDRLWPPAS